MRRKKLTPSAVRRCAIFLALGGALALRNGQAEGGIAPVEPYQDRARLVASGPAVTPALEVKESVVEDQGFRRHAPGPLTGSSSDNRGSNLAVSPDDLAGPGITGGNWFAGLQQGVNQAFDPRQDAPAAPAAGKTGPAAASPLSSGVKANAIPSLPSFWSGLTCCVALALAGMFPRFRRAFR